MIVRRDAFVCVFRITPYFDWNLNRKKTKESKAPYKLRVVWDQKDQKTKKSAQKTVKRAQKTTKSNKKDQSDSFYLYLERNGTKWTSKVINGVFAETAGLSTVKPHIKQESPQKSTRHSSDSEESSDSLHDSDESSDESLSPSGLGVYFPVLDSSPSNDEEFLEIE